ncbi:MAG: hypothetical protein ACXAEL_05065, partial [Candidatus Hodarchaeales archaeon]
MNKPRNFSTILMSSFLLVIVVLGNITAADSVGQATQRATDPIHYYIMDKSIVILYDPTDRYTNHTANAIYTNFKLVYENTVLRPVLDTAWLKGYLRWRGPSTAIFIHVFQSSLTGVELEYSHLDWHEFFTILLSETRTPHVLGMGNGMKAASALKDFPAHDRARIHTVDEGDQTDGQVAFIYVMWECAEIFSRMGRIDARYSALAQDLRYSIVQYFADNANQIMTRSFDPVEPIGVIDAEERAKPITQFEKENPPTIQAVDVNTSVKPPLLLYKVPNNQKTRPGTLLDPSRSSAVDVLGDVPKPEWGVAVGNLPVAGTGLQGPIAGVSDPVLKLLLQVGSVLGLPMDPIAKVIIAMEKVKDLAGFFNGEIQPDSDLGEFLKELRTQFPYSKEFLPYFDLISLAMAKLRSDVPDLEDSWQWLIEGFGNLVGEPATNSTMLTQELNSTFQKITIALNATENPWIDSNSLVEGLIGNMMDGYLQDILEKLMNDTLGLSQSDTQSIRPIWNETFTWISRLFAERDLYRSLWDDDGWSLLLQTYYDGMATLDDMAADSDILNGTAALLKLMLSTMRVGFSETLEEETTDQMLEEVLYWILPEDIASAEASINATVTELLKIIDNTRQSAETSVAKVSAAIQLALATNLRELRRADWIDFLTKLVLFLTARENDAFLITGEFPTVQSLFSQYYDIIEANDSLAEVLGTITNSVIGILAVTTDETPIKRMMGGRIEGYSNIVSGNVSTFVLDLCGLTLTSTQLANSTFMEKVTEFAEIMLGLLQIIVNGWGNPLQTVFQTLMLTTASSLIKGYQGPDFDISFQKRLNQWLLDFLYRKYKEQTFRTPSDIDILFEAKDAYQTNYSAHYEDNVKPIIMSLVRTRNIFTNGIRWFYTSLMMWQERKSQELLVELVRDIYDTLSGGSKLLAAAKTKATLEDMGYWERLENDPQFADLKGISMEKNVITVTDPDSPYAEDLDKHPTIASAPPKKSGGSGSGTESKYVQQVSAIPLAYHGRYTIRIGTMFSVVVEFHLGLDLILDFDVDEFAVFLAEQIFEGNQIWEKSDAELFVTFLQFLTLTPTMYADVTVTAKMKSDNALTSKCIGLFGEFIISGGAWFKLALFTFKGTMEVSDAFKILEWGFRFSIQLGVKITIIDVLTGGTGKGLSEVMKYIGLELLSLTLYIRIEIEIVKRAASKSGPEESYMALTIVLGARLYIGIELAIFGISFTATLEIGFTFKQDLAKPIGAIEIWFFVRFAFTFKVYFLFLTITIPFSWEPVRINLTPSPGSKDPNEPGGFGPDGDGDGLSDAFELLIAGLNPDLSDSDGDGLPDKFEYLTSKTDPGATDTDGDGLSDFDEILRYGTNPRFDDTDFDALTDFEEVTIYKTDPFEIDTDGDGLDDAFEVNTAWNISLVTPSVTEVLIGGVPYNNHTDPLNPDTDRDGLLDGAEGPRGIWYGAEYLTAGSLDGDRDSPREAADPILFYFGFTHPLDNDTDDDSYEQLWDGRISPRRRWLRNMDDGAEVYGRWITFINKYGEPTLNLTRTNPCNPDTDGDTGRDLPGDSYGYWWTETWNENVTYNYFLNSDGYELALDPPSDPNDGDSDDDGLIDGLEGTLRPDSNHTHYLMADTDGDGLGDMQELQLGSDPRAVDTDHDMVKDGDEYFVYGTEPFLPDSDFDGLLDGEELFIFHSNPRQRDSDGDGLRDAAEVFDHGTDPVDEDSDNDGLTDFDEVTVYGTDPRIDDTDGDGLLDGEEILTYKTDPFLWDTDNDSIHYLNESGLFSFPLSDSEEVKHFKTDPAKADTDGDGLPDGWELYLASGWVPTQVLEEPIFLNPLSNDTDADGLGDMYEIAIMNRTSLVYPYIAFYVEYPFNCRPDRADTDNDGLNDHDEIMMYESDPQLVDSDNDTLLDGHEVFYHGTNPGSNDTDGDGLRDDFELTNVFYLSDVPPEIYADYSPIYLTNASDPDTD